MGDFEVFNEMGDKVVSLGDFAVWAILQFGRFCSLGDFGVGDSGVGDSGVGDFSFLKEWAILQFGRFWSGRFWSGRFWSGRF